MIVLIDNYDSFTHNLYQYAGEIYGNIKVVRNDEITIQEIEKLMPKAIIISPGPGRPEDAGISIEVVQHFSGKIPILGICLGHQAIGSAFDGKIVHAQKLMHGKSSRVRIDTASPLFKGLPEEITVGRYHSLVIQNKGFLSCLSIISTSDDNEIMAVSHKQYPVYGLQFHPESVLTRYGKKIMHNFICDIARLPAAGMDMSAFIIPQSERHYLKPYIKKVIDGKDMTEQEAENTMNCIMDGGATESQIASFVTALRMKGETIDEITGFARVMRDKAASLNECSNTVDIVGTGGDLANTFNISTTTAFVAAGAGAKVAKHGNRSVSSRSGSADVLEALGIKIDISPAQAQECIEKAGIGFMFAQVFHKSMRFAAIPRREIGVRSVFNILGPLSNPASSSYMLLGVYDKELLETMARVLMNLGVKKGLVVCGEDGLDEVTLTNKTHICELDDGKIIKYEMSPEEFGIQKTELKVLVGGDAYENAQITLDILNGMERGPKRDIVLLNTAVALYAAKSCDNIRHGVELAAESIDSGKAMDKLKELRLLTNSF